mmetsp:Transcript_9389/g.14320  ORF Transcript_9389/g.14320 Transcript_9389/m.14320 type:complete len:201 (-) Transcript_9389:222-824(-)
MGQLREPSVELSDVLLGDVIDLLGLVMHVLLLVETGALADVGESVRLFVFGGLLLLLHLDHVGAGVSDLLRAGGLLGQEELRCKQVGTDVACGVVVSRVDHVRHRLLNLSLSEGAHAGVAEGGVANVLAARADTLDLASTLVHDLHGVHLVDDVLLLSLRRRVLVQLVALCHSLVRHRRGVLPAESQLLLNVVHPTAKCL